MHLTSGLSVEVGLSVKLLKLWLTSWRFPLDATGDPNYGQKPAGLSVGAIVGLALGAVVALSLIVIAIYLFIRLHRAGRRRYMEPLDSVPDRNGVRYDKIEGPPRKFFSPFASATRVVSYKPGLNFDLVQNRRGDFVELSESNKKISKSQPSTTSGSGSGFLSRTSLESNTKRSKKANNDTPRLGSDVQPGASITSFFSRAKEVKPQEGNVRIDLADDGASSSVQDNPTAAAAVSQHPQHPPHIPQYDQPSTGPGIYTINPAHHSDRPALLD